MKKGIDPSAMSPVSSEQRRETAPKSIALRYLGYRSRTVSEMERYLQRVGFGPDEVRETVAWLMDLGYLDDERFAAEWISSRAAGRKLGPRRLRAELSAKGVAREVIDAALASFDHRDVREHAMEAAGKRAAQLQGVDPVRAKRRLYGYLHRLGYGHEVIVEVVARVLSQRRHGAPG